MDHHIHLILYQLLPIVRTAAYMAVVVIYQETVVCQLELPPLPPEQVAAETNHPGVVYLDLARVVHFDMMPLQHPRKPGMVDPNIPTWMSLDHLGRKIAVGLA